MCWRHQQIVLSLCPCMFTSAAKIAGLPYMHRGIYQYMMVIIIDQKLRYPWDEVTTPSNFELRTDASAHLELSFPVS